MFELLLSVKAIPICSVRLWAEHCLLLSLVERLSAKDASLAEGVLCVGVPQQIHHFFPFRRLSIYLQELMMLLLKLDSILGVDPAGSEARRLVSRRIVGMKEILDGICEAKVDDDWDFDFDDGGVRVVVFNWDQTVAGMKAGFSK
ncbi:BAG family molecular chaperone regulator 5, mitochondrial [Linum grandiflorum]